MINDILFTKLNKLLRIITKQYLKKIISYYFGTNFLARDRCADDDDALRLLRAENSDVIPT